MPELKPDQQIPNEVPSAPIKPERESSVEQVERNPQHAAEQPQPATEQAAAPSPQSAPQQARVAPKDPETQAIESILAEGMDEFFKSLSRPMQLEFKQSGEATAQKIQSTIRSGSYGIKDIVLLIVNWLKTLPGINKFFLEQEAKIKADKIVNRYKQ